MPEYQLYVAVAVAVTAACSAFVLALSGVQEEGKIALPEESFDESRDPFNVTQPDDVIDGEPLNEARFWANVRLRKMVIGFCLCGILSLQTVKLAWFASTAGTTSIVEYALHVAFALYTLTVTLYSLPTAGINTHAHTMVHLSVLTFVATILLGVTAIVPGSYHTAMSAPPSFALTALWYTVFALYFVALAVASSTPLGPTLYYPAQRIYDEKTIAKTTNTTRANVSGAVSASVLGALLFSYSTSVVMLGNTSESLEIGDLPIVPGDMRATNIYAKMKIAMREIRLKIGSWTPRQGSGYDLAWRLVKVNRKTMIVQMSLAAVSAIIFYIPAFFLSQLLQYLEADPDGNDRAWGWFFSVMLFFWTAFMHVVTAQLWRLSTQTFQVRLKIQLNSTLFAKTLVRKDVASSAAAPKKDGEHTKSASGDAGEDKKKDDNEFSSKAQVMTLMTTDVDRVSEFSWHIFTLVDSPIEIVIASIFLYNLLGVSSLVGLLVTCLFLPLNHFAGKVVVRAQDGLMEARDERVALMNEILGAIRMLKFMAWERSFEKKALEVRNKELRFQRISYLIETAFTAIWEGSPLLVTLISFWHFAVWRGEALTPAIAFTSISVFNEMRFALNTLPETFINILQSFVSMRRIENYLGGVEVSPVSPLDGSTHPITVQSATIAWPQSRSSSTPGSAADSASSTPARKFMLLDVSLNFPQGELSLICGKLGSGKTLLLLALLGEADILTGQILCPRSPPDALAKFAEETISPADWIVPGMCGYVPQAAWLRNASIRDNVLFTLPFDAERYQKTLEVCALVHDLEILEDGDESEIGERGVNLSGGQKARVSLARAVYSRAEVLLLDDVLSAVDAHTAHHLYTECLKGDLMRGRTVILVSHHVQLCSPGAAYVVALDNGRLQWSGSGQDFAGSAVMESLVQSKAAAVEDADDPEGIADDKEPGADSETTSVVTAVGTSGIKKDDGKTKAPRKLIEEEKRAVGRVGKNVWLTYLRACGALPYWSVFVLAHVIGSLTQVVENAWLRHWARLAGSIPAGQASYYVGIYAAICGTGILVKTSRPLVLYIGSLHASKVLYERLLETVLFAQIRFHDTVSRGRLLNRFGKDFEGIDSSLADNLGRTFSYLLNVITVFTTITYIGGWQFLVAAAIIGSLYYNSASLYAQTSRDMRRLDSVARSPLYSMYGETIAGVPVVRAFGASSKFLRDMLRCVDVSVNPFYWMWGVNRWLSMRFDLLSSLIAGVTGLIVVASPTIDAALAGIALTFALNATNDILFMTRRFVGLEQSMVAVERIKEYTDLVREAPEFVEPRPAADWPASGAVEVQDLTIRYAPELPNVLHGLNFKVHPGEKIGILGRTGSGKSTLALSFFRFVEATEGSIKIDGVDIASLGLTDLRGKLTIIPQDPTILSGTLRTTLDVFDEYEDADIFEALRRVHLIPSGDVDNEESETVNANVFRNLDSPVSEGGENFSTGEKQLICMARAILKRSKVLVMDEATASVDYATDELISKTIREEFASSTIMTIAHRLRSVISYDRVMVLDQGRLKEFDRPATLLADPSSAFYQLCRATGKDEFSQLKKMAGI